MNTVVLTAIIAIIAALLGFFLGNYIERLKRRSSQSTLEEREKQLRLNLEALDERLRVEMESTR